MIKVNGQEINITKFPNGESCIPVENLNSLTNDNRVKVEFKWYGDEDIIHLYFVLKHLIAHNITKRDIYIYYMPYSRMDRDQNGNCFTLSHLTEILNNAICDEDNVYICEPHSSVTLNLLKNANRINVITPLMNKILKEQDIDIICYPDKGARDRFGGDEVGLPIIYCNKRRDFNTGEILGLDIISDVDLTNKNVLILDDLCSKGGTFYFTSKRLKEEKVNNIYLGVCHMESTVQYGKILNEDSSINHVYCTDSMLDTNSTLYNPLELLDKLTIYSVEKFINDNKLVEISKEVQ